MIEELLNLSDSAIVEHLPVLAADYFRLTGKSVCMTCPANLKDMLIKLKKLYNMSRFQLRLPNVIYKLALHQPTTISNDIMTDELAIAFIKIRPERIDLFSKYPEDWRELCGLNKPKQVSKVSKESSKAKTITKAAPKKPCKGCKDRK